MKRSKMVQILADEIHDNCVDKTYAECSAQADSFLTLLEKEGMQPPSIRGDYSRALSNIYMFPDYNIWEEVLEKDEKVMEAKAKIEEYRNLSPQQRKDRRLAAQAKLNGRTNEE